MNNSGRDSPTWEPIGPTGPAGPAALADLARGSLSGDAESRDAFLAAARPLMLRWAHQLVDDTALAEDVVQDALIEVDRTLGALREPAAVAGWLRLAVRKHADRLRRKQGRGQGPVLDLDLGLDPSRESALGMSGGALADDPALAAERAQDRAMIRRALAQAADADRLLLVLRYYGGWGESELAAFLGIGGGAVRKRLHDARRRLRRRIAVGTTGPIRRSSRIGATGAAGATRATDLTDTTDPWETLMTDARALLGTTHRLDDPALALPPGRPPLTRPTSPGRLPTGFKVLDTLVPLPRGGTVDLTGPVGTGHLALLAEILRNLATAASGPTALVAVAYAERTPKGVSARLWKLTEQPAPAADRTAVVYAPPGSENQAVDAAAQIAGWLAHDGATVLLALDEAVADGIDPDRFDGAVGVCAAGPGSVTGFRVAPNPVDAQPVAPWPGTDAEVRLGTAEMVAATMPAVDVLASRSALLDGEALPAPERDAAVRARALLADAAELRAFLTQPLWLLEETTGTPGGAVPVQDAVAGLAHVLGQGGRRG